MSSTTTAVRKRKTFSPLIYETIQEPVLLRELLVDDIYLLGGQFAILCQFAHPGLAKGSYLHSSFASRIPQRLQNTARFLNAAVYGTPDEKRAVFSVIHGYHNARQGRRVRRQRPGAAQVDGRHALCRPRRRAGRLLRAASPTGRWSCCTASRPCTARRCACRPTCGRPPWTTSGPTGNRNIETLDVTDMARKLWPGPAVSHQPAPAHARLAPAGARHDGQLVAREAGQGVWPGAHHAELAAVSGCRAHNEARVAVAAAEGDGGYACRVHGGFEKGRG
ncbi:hypothetical protein J3459_017310 [Metarhizium acridum]|nr:hypothetical protein J3459_017310 [Metarhizium acridum]